MHEFVHEFFHALSTSEPSSLTLEPHIIVTVPIHAHFRVNTRLHCLRNQHFQQGKICAKSSRTAMTFVLRRTSTYQHGISTYEKKYNHVLPCTAMYCHVLPCTAIYCQKYVLVRTRTYFCSFVCISPYRYVPVCTAMRKFTNSTYRYMHHKSTWRYKAEHTSTYRYVPP